MAEIKSKEQIEKRILNLSKDLDKFQGSKAHGVRQQINALNWVIG